MYQPTEFLDGENIIIINDIPRYRYTGVTYKDKLKNGLSLDYVFGQQDLIPIMNEIGDEDIVVTESNKYKMNYNLINYEENYDCYDMQTEKIVKKGKQIKLKKRQSRNVKKNSIRQDGFSYKLFTIEQNLSDETDFDDYDNYNDYDDETYSWCCSCCFRMYA